ncbi:MAG: hypothetical protein ACYTFI_22600 [Planctomycetota bacterium]|jgi:hypothetical protein
MATDERCAPHGYSGLEVFIANLPYAVMVLSGSAVLVIGFGFDQRAWIAAGAYLAYGILGALWIMIFLCRHCPVYGTHSCPCGYGALSAKLRSRGNMEVFARKFRRHIPVIVPLWLIPPGAGGYFIYLEFSWLMAGLLCAFALDAFVILPLYSKKHGCEQCPQKENCPWMKEKGCNA